MQPAGHPAVVKVLTFLDSDFYKDSLLYFFSCIRYILFSQKSYQDRHIEQEIDGYFWIYESVWNIEVGVTCQNFHNMSLHH